MSLISNLAKKVESHLKREGITQLQLAEQVGLKQSAISFLLNGKMRGRHLEAWLELMQVVGFKREKK